jgi:hypothetical protein
MSRNNSVVTKRQVKQIVKSLTAQEWNKKYILTNIGTPGASQSVDATGSISSLLTVAQGTTQQTRVGNYAVVKRVFGNISMYADSTDVQNTVRVLIVSWTDANTMTASDVLVSASAYHTCFYNLNNIENGKLKILHDSRHGINYNGTGPKVLHFDMRPNLKVQWNSTGSAAPISNAIYVMFVSDSSVATHPYVQSSFCCVIENE